MCIECRAAFDEERSKIHRVNTNVYCACGCGQLTKIAMKDWPEFGHVKGEPLRYVIGHNTRTAPYPAEQYTVDAVTGCWVWNLGLDRDGYGRLWINGRNRRAHRVFYEQRFGELPAGMVPDHCCPHGPNRACVNPDHMRPRTLEDNSRFKQSNKLGPVQAKAIRLLAGRMPQREIAEVFGVSQGAISETVRGITWPEKKAS